MPELKEREMAETESKASLIFDNRVEEDIIREEEFTNRDLIRLVKRF